MRKSSAIIASSGAIVGLAVGAAIAWRRNPRVGTTFVNSVVNPALIRHNLAGKGASELGTLEHFGRRTGVRRLTPVHPEPIRDGFRVLVPLGRQSQWALNVLAAGHCRLQLHDVVYELDEPTMIPASEVRDVPSLIRRVEGLLGFEYLLLRRYTSAPGSLESAEAVVPALASAGVRETSVPETPAELVASTRA